MDWWTETDLSLMRFNSRACLSLDRSAIRAVGLGMFKKS
jgi:hypothetical protein